MRMALRIAATWIVFLGSPACDESSSPVDGHDGYAPGDLVSGDTSGDPTTADGMSGDEAAGDAAGGDPMAADFQIRQPQMHTLTCEGGTGTADLWDTDHVCRIDNAQLQADIYVQATPTSCRDLNSWVPFFDDVQAWARQGDVVVPISAAYEWGGNHHNDLIKFELDGQVYVIWHSSISMPGWRACAPPDCLLPCSDGTTFATCDPYAGFDVDGCARDPGTGPPPLPAICVVVAADGTVPPLLDPWVAHAGDPDYPLLPCFGD